jgi:apolipoprotein N-acyltransferase
MNRILVITRLRAAPGPVKYGISLIAGAAAAFAFAPYYALPLLFLAFPLLLVLVDHTPSWRKAAVLGWFFGFGHFLVGFHWIGNAFQVDAETFGWAEYPALLLLSGVMAFYPALALGVTKHLWARLFARGVEPFNLRGILIFALLWSVTEWLRGHLFTGFPWNLLGYVWGFSDAMLQPAALFGIYGLSLLTAVLVALPLLWLNHPLRSRQGFRGFMLMAGLALAMLVFGLLSLGLADKGAWADKGMVSGVRLRLVQANIDQKEKWNPETRRAHLDRYMRLSEQLAALPPTDIIWPETAVSYFVGNDPAASRFIASALPNPDGHVITGAPRMEQDSGKGMTLWNSLFVVGRGGDLLAGYDKFHLVPFGEYLPFRPFMSIFGLDKMAAGDVDFSPGPGPQTISIAGLPPFSPLICYEIIFPGQVVKSGDRPQWILNITNDAWFGESMGPYQHLVAARTRAVEEGIPVIRIAGTGISAIIDAEGRVLTSLPLDTSGVIDGGLPSARAIRPIYARFGDWSYLFLVSIAIIGVIRRRNVRKAL